MKSGGRQAPHGHPSEVTATLTPSNPKPALTCFFYQLLGTSQLPPRRGSMPTTERGGLAGLFISMILFRVRCMRGLSGWGKPLVRCADAARLTTSINRLERSVVQTPAQWRDECGGAERRQAPFRTPSRLLCFVLIERKEETQLFSVGKSYR